jgi:beta-glucanase (GH16 family)
VSAPQDDNRSRYAVGADPEIPRWRGRSTQIRVALVCASAVAILLGTATSSGLSAAAASTPDCGSTQIPKDAPTSTPAPSSSQLKKKQKSQKKKLQKKRSSSKRKRSARKKRRKVATKSSDTWQCTFSDDFNGTSLDSTKWVAQRTDWSGYTSGLDACFVDTPDNISVSGGTLQLTARKEAAPFTCKDGYGDFTTQYTSGMVSTYGKFSQAYGRFEARAKISSARVAGLQTSFWLWPDDSSKYGGWPGSGEIDVAEMYSRYADHAFPYVHYNPASFDPNVTSYSCVIGNPDDFHTYALEWTTTQLKFIYDGKTCLVDNWNPAGAAKPAPFDRPFMIALTQALGIGDNQFDSATTPLPATTVVDYVRAWQ